ncbi:PepSY domain-containing protein [Dokdonella sp. MW10]|uniref:PepSY domain-containing protein n=1 Tax=Dokdonella sp. MW10 TaxID=2992926 RepID=UPI003F7F6F02
MRLTRLSLAAALALCVAVPAIAEENATAVEPVASAGEALARIAEGGLHAPYDLEFRHGLWSADATTADGVRVDVVVDGVTRALWTNAPGSTTPFLTAVQVRERLVAAGYTQIEDIEFDDGFWEAEARRGDGVRVDLVLHPVTGVILAETIDGPGGTTPGGTILTADQIRAALTAAGYTQIRDLEFDDGFWEADARNRAGQRVELTIDPYTGAVVREERD